MQLYNIDEFRASDTWPYAISAGCVVYRIQKAGIEVLLLRREAAHPNDPHSTTATFMLPKGHVAFNESLLAAAERETKEEAGVKASIQTYLGSLTHEFTHPRYQTDNIKTIHYFAASWQEDLPAMDAEHDSRAWVAVEEAQKLLGSPNPKGEDEIIERLSKFLELTRAA